MAKKHIRFDWAAKKMLRDKKNFDILEGFLSELLKEDIKIEGLLESESNQEEDNEKYNRVDLYAENAKGEHIIIEIQNTRELDYLMRMLFGTSKAVTEYLEVGAPYSDIKKVIAISIIYFGLGKGDDYVYVGQTKFTGLHSKKELELTTAQKELLKKPTVHQAFPEYYLIQTTRFKDIINDSLDEWIYFFKNNEVLDEFKAKGMEAVREKLTVHNMPDEDKKRYKRFLDNLHTEASIAQTVVIEQEERIKEELEKEREKAKEELEKEREKAKEELEKEREKAKEELEKEREKAKEELEKEREKAKEELEKEREKAKEEFEKEREKAKEKFEKEREKVKKELKKQEIEMVIQLIKMNLGNDQIIKVTGLSEEEIEHLKKEIEEGKH